MKINFPDKEDLKKEILNTKRDLRDIEDELTFALSPVEKRQAERAIANLEEKLEKLNRQRQVQIERVLNTPKQEKDPREWF